MKTFLSSLVICSLYIPVNAQEANVYSVCTNYQENYTPGYYDRNGNYVQGNVNTQQYNVPCRPGTYYRPNTQSPVRYCSPARTTLGGLIGGGIAAAVSKKDSWSWSIPLGAVLGSGASSTGCY